MVTRNAAYRSVSHVVQGARQLVLRRAAERRVRNEAARGAALDAKIARLRAERLARDAAEARK